MADYLVTDTELTSVANAIRTKGGTSANLSFPTEFVSAINNIPTGGTPTLQTKTKTYTPTTSQQTETITADNGYDGLNEVDITVNAMPTGEVTAPASANGTNPTMSAVSIGQIRKLRVTGDVSITPSVTTAGYVSSGTAGNTEVSFLTNTMVKSAGTIKPSSSSNSISANTYLEGQINYLPVICENLTASNIKDGVTVKIGCATDDDSVTSVTGTYTGESGGATLGTKSITTNGTYNAEDDNLDGYSSVTVNVEGADISPFTKFKSGTVNYSSNQTSTITITSSIGFVPTFFCLYRRDDTSTQNIVLMSCAYSLASNKQLRQSIMRGSSATAVTSRTAQNTPSGSSSGALQIQSDGTVKFYAMGTSYILNGYYKWFALA